MNESMFERQDRTMKSVKKLVEVELFDKSMQVLPFYAQNDFRQCCDCRFWCGRCREGKVNCIAWSRACEKFESSAVVEIVPVGTTLLMEVEA